MAAAAWCAVVHFPTFDPAALHLWRGLITEGQQRSSPDVWCDFLQRETESVWWCSAFLSFHPLMLPFKRDIKNRNINLADGAIGLLAGACTLCCSYRPLSPCWSAERCSGPSPTSSFLQLWVLGEPSGAEGVPAAPSSRCNQGALNSVSSEPPPKGGELLSALIVGKV